MTDNQQATIDHKIVDEIVTRRALEAIDALTKETGVLRERITGDADISGDDTKRLATLTQDVVQHVSILAAFLDVAEFGLKLPEELTRRLQEGRGL